MIPTPDSVRSQRHTSRRVFLLGATALMVLAVGGFTCARGEPADGTVIRVKDGDSLIVRTDGTEVEVRLDGVDAPEWRAPFGKEAKQFVKEQVEGKPVSLTIYEQDRYGRSVARVFIGGRDLSLLLVDEGLAWHYTRYSDDRALADAERKARAAKRNIWSLANPAAPWDARAADRAANAGL